jgi:pimeloyl-ACP methyl ester carboxylesterase/hemolysin activation/secretion protein
MPMKNLLTLFPIIIFVVGVLPFTHSAQSAGAEGDRIPLFIRTIDNVPLHGDIFRSGNDKVIIYCHRLLRDAGGEEVERLLRMFSDEYDVISISFRGHASSSGSSNGGGREILDIRAAVSYAKNSGYRFVAVIGAGMGGAAGMRAALIFQNIDALVVLSPSGFSPNTARFPIGFLSDIALDSAFGIIPLRIVTNTRLGERYSSGFPVDLIPVLDRVPTMIIHSSGDRFTSAEKLQRALEEYFDPEDVMIVPGTRHAEDLMDRDILMKVRAFLDEQYARGDKGSPSPAGTVPAFTERDIARIRLSGDLPIPERIVLKELRARFTAGARPMHERTFSVEDITRELEEVLDMRGYSQAAVTVVDTAPVLSFRILVPRIGSVTIEGNRFVKERYLTDILGIDSDYYNAYELDAAIRRLSRMPAVESALPSVRLRDNGNIDIGVKIRERRSYRFLIATKFTDMDKYFGVGATWNEFNPTGLQYEGRVLIGAEDKEFLTSHRLGRNLLDGTLHISGAYFDIAKSRDDLDYVFTRQELRERGGDFSVRYRVSTSISATVSAFGRKYLRPVGLDQPVAEGNAFGGSVKLDLSGRLPFQGPRPFHWWHTFYYRKMGPNGTGDFYFDTYQFNLTAEYHFLRNSKIRTKIHGGWISGNAPPQELLSLGGMHTFPGYPDDEFVDARMFIIGQELYLSARNFVNETSVWAPLRLILSFHAGTVWGTEEDFDTGKLKTDVVFELDYKKTLRFGIAIPTGDRSGDSPRVYIGWGEHVY